MTMQSKKIERSDRPGAIELAEDRLDQVVGGARSYAPLVFKKHIDKATP